MWDRVSSWWVVGYILLVGAHIRPVVALRVAASAVGPVFRCEIGYPQLLPILQIFYLNHWVGEALRVLAVFLCECDAEVTDPRIGEVLSAA